MNLVKLKHVETRRSQMFIIPTLDVLLLATAITIVPAALQWFVRLMWSAPHALKNWKVDLPALMSQFDRT